jgi:hypothetical protein
LKKAARNALLLMKRKNQVMLYKGSSRSNDSWWGLPEHFNASGPIDKSWLV